MHNYDLCKINH